MMIEQRGRLEISRKRVLHNLRAIREKCGGGGGRKICATVKANAYGHGIRELLPILQNADVNWFAVYSMHEVLRGLMDNAAILVLAPVVSHRGHRAPPHTQWMEHVRVNITDEASVHALTQTNQPTCVHMQVDTGLTRGGVAAENALALADLIAASPNLKLEGIFSHLSHGDEAGHETIAAQTQQLNQIAAKLKTRHPNLLVHIQNSGGVWNVSDEMDMVRVGIALYGLQPNPSEPIPQLQPIARLIAPILDIHDRPAGVGVGYGHTFITSRHSRLAIVPVGYADGYPRAMSNRGIVQINNADAPIVGRVSMDQIVIDITHLPETQIGDDVTVIAWNPQKPNSIDHLAAATNTIGYEIATGLGPRLQRIVVD